jgi:hypothetical protein
MKMFFSTLAAILVAAAIIWFITSAHNARVEDARTDAFILNAELDQAGREWAQRESRDSNFDPNMEKLQARYREIREASAAGKPIPPSPW